MKKWLKRIGFVTALLTLIAAVAAYISYDLYVVRAPGDHISMEHIQRLITRESPVLYRDGKTPIGVFFDEEHRQYVKYEDIPQAWVQGITSAEDQRYFSHPGVDLKGLTRAMKQNVEAGTLVSGGSTLTMQTSENLFHPGTFTLKGKYWEVLDTLRLERHFSKEEILEFYANQFHVYGNGRGLGIAARYFFDKDVGELTLHESAFLAGLVKIPGRYNPFIGKTEEDRARAAGKAKTRTAYVLRRMMEEGHIDAATYDALKDKDLPFKKGSFRYDSSVLLDEVERQLEMTPFLEILASAGIDNPATSGIQIITTLDEGAQRAATYGLWHHLSEAGSSLEGLAAADFVHSESLAPKPDPNDPPVRAEFRYAVVKSVDEGVVLDLGGHPGVLDDDAISRAARMLAVAEAGRSNAKPTDDLREQVRAVLEPGKVVWVSVRSPDEAAALCDLEVRPELQGAVVVLEDGEIRAMVGGNDNRNFNRASEAKRQLGSTWKMLVYNAAFQLGWTPIDVLDNRRAGFPFTGAWYYPRPDHKSEDFVSIGWAGVRSENLASIWLLYHLTDRLNPEQVRRLADVTGLSRQDGESKQDYIRRIRDDNGVIATDERLQGGLFRAVIEEVVADLAFSGHPEDATELRSLHYGRGFSSERKRILKAGGRDMGWKLRAVDANFLHLEGMLPGCVAQAKALRTATEPIDPSRVSDLSVKPTAAGFLVNCGTAPEGWVPAGDTLVTRLGEEELPPVLGGLLIDARLHESTITAVRSAMNARATKLADVDPYSPELLYLHPDFRLMLGLKYMSQLAEEMGVQSELPPVLSMPLGAVDISLLEAGGIYQGFLDGKGFSFPGEGFDLSATVGSGRYPVPPQRVAHLLIKEIRNRDGEVLYRATPKELPIADPVAARLTTDILRNVVTHGTGRRARAIAGDHTIGGKTGTTNDFKNAAFVGHAWTGKEHHDAVTVAVYVGYDDNRKMVNQSIKLAGASGALPAWMGTVRGMIALGLLGEGEILEAERDYVRVPVVDKSGLSGNGSEARSVLVYGTPDEPIRRFAPFGEAAQDAQGVAETLPENLELPPDEQEEEILIFDTGLAIEPRMAPSIWDEID